MSKTKIAVLFGGPSPEHAISVISARTIINALSSEKYHIYLIGIDLEGKWHLGKSIDELVANGQVSPSPSSHQVLLQPYKNGKLQWGYPNQNISVLPTLDVVFPVLHGRYGEDGVVQGLLTAAGLPFVGSCVLGSAINIDKAMTKIILHAHGIPVLDGADYSRSTWENEKEKIIHEVESCLGFPVFVKPTCSGSTIGVSKVNKSEEIERAVECALEFGTHFIIEKAVAGVRELECAVLEIGNKAKASCVGEVATYGEYHTYESKYNVGQSAITIPALIPDSLAKEIRRLTLICFEATRCRGLARVDFFLDEDNRLYVNEVNSLPGFTPLSLYPLLWDNQGMSHAELVDQLVQTALLQHQGR